ncbi:hypothetical protein PT974_04063 [Cladobotryum mycophilum]|uniref:3'-5' exonuclease domain-containing protein n=1 Tax=Cladobotryum mycophilum TaxID=491253 RepID=A0ABR0SU34_9HYPO
MSNTTSTTTSILISTATALEALLSLIHPSCTLYLDLEGKDLSRDGNLSIITLLVYDTEWIVRLVDVLALGASTFTIASPDGKTLKSIFEDPNIPKCFWDVRNDADALWAHYQVDLAGVVDIQLLENASRVGDKMYIRGLDKCIQYDLKPGTRELKRWLKIKKDIKSRFSGDLFAIRPMEAKTIEYCTNDVVHLPALHKLYRGRLDRLWLSRVKEESAQRVREAHSPGYEPRSPSKTLGPWGSSTKHLRTLDDILDELEGLGMDELEQEILGEDDFDFDDFRF